MSRYVEKSRVHSPKSKVWYAWTLGLVRAQPDGEADVGHAAVCDAAAGFLAAGKNSTVRDIGRQLTAQHATRNTQHAHVLVEKLPFLALTIASSVVTFLAQRSEAVVSLEQHPFGLRVANALVAYAAYLGKMVWPAKLAVIYPLPNQIPAWQIAVAVVVLAVISVLAWRVRKNAPYVLIGWLWFLGTLVPVIGLVQVGGQALADRYTYVPLIGVFIALAYGIDDWMARFRIPKVAVSAAAAAVLLASLFAHRISAPVLA